ncbi:MAG: preprotein translocase subunit SecG [Ferruginibacter sp.]
MLVIFGILVIIASVVLGLIVLIQNPKGGGLSASLGGFSNQLMGVKQTTDVLEKGTWIFAAVVGLLCLVSPAFIPKSGSQSNKVTEGMSTQQPAKAVQTPAAPATTVPMPGATPAKDSGK